MVLAYHAILNAYGFWLANDPGGSWSDFVASWEILRYGKPIPANTRASVAHRPHDSLRRLSAKSALLRAPVIFNGPQAREIARGFSDAINASGYEIFACAIMTDHVHAVVRRHRQPIERVVGHLEGRATQRLLLAGLHPFGAERDAKGTVPPIWAEYCWKVFLNTSSSIDKSIRYTNDNPRREGLPAQNWFFLHHNRTKNAAAEAAG